MRSGMVHRVRTNFAWFTAHDWLEFTTTGSVYAFSGEVEETVLNMIKKLREAISILLKRFVC